MSDAVDFELKDGESIPAVTAAPSVPTSLTPLPGFEAVVETKDIDIVNLGLSAAGGVTIDKMSDTSPAGRFISQFYKHWRKQELTKENWSFATSFRSFWKDLRTTAIKQEPWKYTYLRPPELLGILDRTSDTWEGSDDYIFTNFSKMNNVQCLVNIKESGWPPHFCEIMILRVAAEAAITLGKTESDQRILWGKYDTASKHGAAINVAGLPPEPIRDDEFPPRGWSAFGSWDSWKQRNR